MSRRSKAFQSSHTNSCTGLPVTRADGNCPQLNPACHHILPRSLSAADRMIRRAFASGITSSSTSAARAPSVGRRGSTGPTTAGSGLGRCRSRNRKRPSDSCGTFSSATILAVNTGSPLPPRIERRGSGPELGRSVREAAPVYSAPAPGSNRRGFRNW
jgi:hypothetical protein